MSRTENLVTLNSAMTQLMRSIRQVDEMQGIGRARLSALAVLHFGGPCNLSTLAEREMVTRATMHHVIAGLEQDALIRRNAGYRVDPTRLEAHQKGPPEDVARAVDLIPLG